MAQYRLPIRDILDITLAFPYYSIVLSARSAAFKRLFEANPRTTDFTFGNENFLAFRFFLHEIYAGYICSDAAVLCCVEMLHTELHGIPQHVTAPLIWST